MVTRLDLTPVHDASSSPGQVLTYPVGDRTTIDPAHLRYRVCGQHPVGITVTLPKPMHVRFDCRSGKTGSRRGLIIRRKNVAAGKKVLQLFEESGFAFRMQFLTQRIERAGG